ncbi:ribosomal RNA-processing protein 8 isoform X2 [Poeciliopsis prolifica]|uniref:ribosomal RNA-processing protein 8 isoform X2 n=1 Tax=Poeciliopsis prolifica TaxID=188132 RepID=UPI00241394E0|nr:ribosomal RNA-processing protein 8 isoform X2 [Poeciliopsis prolifica]
MFNEDEDWSDEQEGRILSKAVFKTSPKANSSLHLQSSVGRKSLLRTLETLGSTPDWRRGEQEQDSGSETEVPSSPSKKKRKKRRKHGEQSEERQEGGDEPQAVKEKPELKKKKRENKPELLTAPKAPRMPSGETEVEKVPEPSLETVDKHQGLERLSRQQWRNKMKNKKRSKNKFRQNKPEDAADGARTADKREPTEDVKKDPHNGENLSKMANRKRKKEKVKRTNTEREADGRSAVRGRNQPEKLKSGPEGSAEGLEHGAGEVLVASTDRQKPELSRERSLKRQKLQKILLRQERVSAEGPAERTEMEAAVPVAAVPVAAVPVAAVPEAAVPAAEQSRSDSLRSRMEQRLEAARFRYINERLYSTASGEARRMFQQDPEAFWVYHRGYTAQVQRWPANPLDAIIAYIHKRSPSLVVADFGCGDCKIARSVKNKVHSFDLAAACDLVTVCDMAKVPLGDGSVDIAVFCLSLMGTNLVEFLAEANRVLKMRGVLKVAEVASRFDNVQSFTSALAGLGFKLTSKDTENSHFFSFQFVKTGNVPQNVKKLRLQLKPCLYKKR